MLSTHISSKNKLSGISAVLLRSLQILGVMTMVRKILKQIDKVHLGIVKSNRRPKEIICRTHINHH